MPERDGLEKEIADARQTISSDGYPMSIGELTNLYRDGELEIRPEFQRFYRWSIKQKSNLVESLLLGIPLPSIFVAQSESGRWELVDGLQRVSTILELQGELRAEGGKRPALVLQGTKYLPALEGRSWSNSDPSLSLSEAQKLDIKRSKIDIKIIKRDSSAQAKYDLFQRLNSYGTPLTPSEIRSALLVAVSPTFFAWFEGLTRYPAFVDTIQLSDRLLEERYDLELIARFLVLHDRPADQLTQGALRDLSQVLDNRTAEIAAAGQEAIDRLDVVFRKTFDTIAEHGGENIFRRWDIAKGEFRGPFLTTAFEIFALGIGYHVAQGTAFRTDLISAARELWSKETFRSGYSTGKSTEARLVEFVPVGRQLTAASH